MIIRIAENSGFCFGVKRAIQIAEEAVANTIGIVTIGPLIHNPQMVERLCRQGIEVAEDIRSIDSGIAIIRSHGIPLEDREYLQGKGIELIDATCPYVAKTQQIAKSLSESGYPVIILGNEEHPEVIALRSYVKGKVYVVSDVSMCPEIQGSKIGVISQTTQNVEGLRQLSKCLPERFEETRIYNTICNATEIRQESTRKLARVSDLMIVIGGRNSSNTKMLANISAEITETHHIETQEEIRRDWFQNKETVGLTAGASTPDWLIIEIYNKIIKSVGSVSLARNAEDIPVYKEEDHVRKRSGRKHSAGE